MIDNSLSYQITSKTGFRERIESLIPKVLSEQHSFALWFDNRSGKHIFLVHLGEPELVNNFEVEDSDPGFLLSSFEGSNKSFLKADLLINSEDLEIKKSILCFLNVKLSGHQTFVTVAATLVCIFSSANSADPNQSLH